MSGLPLSDRPNRLLYTGENRIVETMERVKGIEPSYSAWKAAALPLSYTRDFNDLAPFRRRHIPHSFSASRFLAQSNGVSVS
jgi:hypothetical protein